MGRSHHQRRLARLAVGALAAFVVLAPSAMAKTIGRGFGPSPNNPITYQPLKHTCNSRLPEPICQDFTVDIKTGLNGGIVSLLYTQSYFCDLSVKSRASTGCEFGATARRLPPGVAGRQFTDPLYLMFPAGPLTKVLPALKPECQHAGLCTDHPSRVDFSRVVGRGTGNALLPVHDHFETTRNFNRPEWHELYAFMVSKASSWASADASHNVRTLFRLSHTRGSGVRGPFPSNIFFFFQTLPGHPTAQEVAWSTLPSPTVNPPTNYDPSITGAADALIDHVVSITGNLVSAFFGSPALQKYTLTPTP